MMQIEQGPDSCLDGSEASKGAAVSTRVPPPHPGDETGMDPIAVRIPNAVRLTGIGRSQLYVLIKKGELETVKMGTSTLVLVSSLKALIEGRRR